MVKNLQKSLSLPFLPIWLTAGCLFAATILTGKALFWGTPMLQFATWWSYAAETLRGGHLPLWNPLLGMGAPLLANYQAGLLYPPNWFHILVYWVGGTAWMAWGLAIVVALHLAWAGTGMALLARRLGLGVLAQTVAGLAFGLCGYLVARAGFLSINAAAAWLPWVLLGLTPNAQGGFGGRGRFLSLTLCLAMQLLAGHAQTAWYTLLLAGLWVGYWSWVDAHNHFVDAREPQNGTRFLPRPNGARGLQALFLWLAQGWGRLGLALALAIGLAAVQLLPTAEYLAQSQRVAAVDYELAMAYSFWPWRLLTLVAPDLYGNPAQGDYWGYANYWEDAIYIGLLPLLLAIGGLIGDRKSGGLRWFLMGVFALALLLALGQNTPVFPWLYSHVPTFGMFQAPARWMLWAEFALVLLAALGAENWRRPEGKGLYWTRLGTAGAFAVSLGAGLTWYLMGDISPSFIRATALAGMWGIGAGALSLLAPVDERKHPAESAEQTKPDGTDTNIRPRLPSSFVHLAWQFSVAFFIAADLFVVGRSLNPAVEKEAYLFSPLAEEARRLAGGQRLYLPEGDEQSLKFTRFLRFDTFDPGEDWHNLRAVLLPNTPLLDGLPTANNFDPLVPGRYANWMEYLPHADERIRKALLELMGVGVVERVDPDGLYGVSFEALNSSARLRFVPCAHSVQDGQEAWTLMTAGLVDFSREALLEGGDSSNVMDCPTGVADGGERRVSLSAESPNRLVVQVESANAGWLVLSDVWYPGWQARVDGQRVPLLRANYLFRAAAVQAGQHEVIFTYQPGSFWVAAAISLASWVVLAFLIRKGAPRR